MGGDHEHTGFGDHREAIAAVAVQDRSGAAVERHRTRRASGLPPAAGYELCRPDPTAQRPLFTDFAPQLLVSHPAQVKVAHTPLLALFTELMIDADKAGLLRSEVDPRRMAAMVMQTVMFTAQSNGGIDEETAYPISAEEIWEFCARGFAHAD